MSAEIETFGSFAYSTGYVTREAAENAIEYLVPDEISVSEHPRVKSYMTSKGRRWAVVIDV